MRTVAELRQAMVEETRDLETRVELAAVQRRARRRRLGQACGAGLAALTVVAVAAYAATASGPGTGQPIGALPTPTISIQVHPSFPSTGRVITTGQQVGSPDLELVLRFHGQADHTWLVGGLLDRRTGVVRDLEGATSMHDAAATIGGFKELDQIDDRVGGVIDYGLFIGTPGRIVAEAHGGRYEAGLAHWSVNGAFTVFWVDHPGTPLPNPTAYPRPSGPTDQPRFVAYDAVGNQIGTSAGMWSHRSDIGVNLEDAPQVGAVIDTRVRLADGGTLLFWFVGTGDSAILKAGKRDPATGTLTTLKEISSLHRPPFASGFYHGLSDLPGPDGTHIMIGEYVGPAVRVVGGAPGAAVTSGYAHWTAHPELIVYWVANVATADYPETSAVAYDAAGKIVGTYSLGK
jgi:hypothetical protein